MYITTTNTIENHEILEYKGVIFGEAISGIDFIKDFKASFRDFFGGRSKTYENELITARTEVLNELEQRAKEIGANAVVGVKFDYEVLGSNNSMIMVTCQGTAVVIKE